MSETQNKALHYAHERQQIFLENLKALVSIPSISTTPAYDGDVYKAAEWLAAYFNQLKFDQIKIFPTNKHPIVYAEMLGAGDDAPTVLIYGHYDVQPAEPLDKWDSPAFAPAVRGDNLYARGTTDMKGQVMASIYAIEAIIKSGELPINVKFIIEGEEEIGSPNLAAFIRNNKDLLASDFALNPDTGMLAQDLPTVTYGLRGLAYFELSLWGPSQDLHSGVFGGVIHNPAQVLTELIAGLHDKQGQVSLPGFYNSVRPLEDDERAELARLPIGDDFFIQNSGASVLWDGEEGFTSVERTGARPTLEVNGLISGFTGEGAKTVIPAFAMAKISCRLVPDQDPKEVQKQFEDFLEHNAPKTVRWNLELLSGAPASISDRNSRWVQAYMRAAENVWGVKPLFKREGGSVPVVNDFQEILGVESVNIGFALPEDNMHGPNEKLHLPTWHKGIDTLIHFFFNLVS
ncbi:MAG: dipeptidase [Chloroflexi bacterium]|nr:dipeptidase [Chloroflexota bacterium]